MPQKSNRGRVSSYHQSVVLDLIRRSENGLSRIELVGLTGLSTQTISNLANKLLDDGLIRETGKIVGRMGKPRTVLQIDPLSRYAVGIHLDPSVITLVLLDLAGAVVARSHIAVHAVADPSQTVRVIASAVDSIIRESAVDISLVLGVGIAAPGPIDIPGGVVVGPPLLTGWERVGLREQLHVEVGLPVFLDKDSSAAAHGELWTTGANATQNFAFIYLGTGLGAGIVINGEVVRGTSSNVGEIGHFSTGQDGPICSCGRPGCVGLMTMPSHLVEEAVNLGVIDGPVDHSDLQRTGQQFRELARLADEGDQRARVVLADAATRLARAVEDVANLLDLDRVVFGGPSWPSVSASYLPVIRDALANRLAVGAIHPLDLRDSALAEEVAAVGAGCLVLTHLLSPRPYGLLAEH